MRIKIRGNFSACNRKGESERRREGNDTERTILVRLRNATRVKYENLQKFELLRKTVRAEENEMKLATNIAQQHTRTQNKTEKTRSAHEIRRIN